MVKLAEHTRMQVVWVPGHRRIDRIATVDQLATQGSPNPLTGSKLAIGTCENVASRVIRS
jgi:ribonuclease HI